METSAPTAALPYLIAMPPPSARPLVPVATFEDYQSAIAVVCSVARDISSVSSRTGPLVPASKLDRWIDGSEAIGQRYMPMAIVQGAMASTLAPMALMNTGGWTNPIPAAVYYALGLVGFVAFCAGIYARNADGRIAKHKARIASERFQVSDVDAMTASFRAAPDVTKASVRRAVEALLAPLTVHMSEEAVARRDAIVASAPRAPRGKLAVRIADLARTAADLLQTGATSIPLTGVHNGLLGVTDPEQRRMIVSAVHQVLPVLEATGALGHAEALRRTLSGIEINISKT